MQPSTVAEPPRNKARSPEELFPLIDYCRAGKLKEVSEWITAGKPLDPPPNRKRSRRSTPLQIAIEKGFYSLTELLLDGGCDPFANDTNALYEAVSRDQIDIAKLLIDRGVSADSVGMESVFDASQQMIALFIANGADPSADLAYYNALCYKVHPLLFVLKKYGERFPDLQRQAEMALCYHCEKGSPRNVGLLLWAGARPDAEVPDPTCSDSTTCAFTVAVRAGRMDIIKQLKPQNYPEVLATLFADVSLERSQPLIDYLIKVGAPLNTKPNGSSDLLAHLLWRLSWGPKGLFGYSTAADTTSMLQAVERICRLGAKWIPNADETPRNIRDRFRKMEAQHLRELFRIFKETGAVSVDLLDSVLESPALRKSLGTHLRSIQETLHPPPPKPLETAVDTGQPQKRHNIKQPEPLTIAQLRANAKTLLLDLLRQTPNLHFTRQSISSTSDEKWLRKRLGMQKDDHREVHTIVAAAAKQLNGRLRSLYFATEQSGRSMFEINVMLQNEAVWPEALREAWSYADSPNQALLTDAGLKLRDLIRSGELGSDWHSEQSVTSKIGLRRQQYCLAGYLFEIATKTDLPVEWDVEGERWGEQRYRIRVSEPASQRQTPKSINPIIDVRFTDVRKRDHDKVRQLLYDELLKTAPSGTLPFYLLFISSRRELRKCLPLFSSTRGDNIAEFFHDLPLNDSLRITFDFRENAPAWYFAVYPKDDWNNALNAIREEMSRPGLGELYGISEDAAKLLCWIQSLPKKRFTGKWTPIVEDACDRWIGIKCPWSAENFGAYLQMLIDGINERTDYDLAVQPWREYSQIKSRIRVSRKSSDVEDVVKRIQWLALKNGSVPKADQIRKKVEELISDPDD